MAKAKHAPDPVVELPEAVTVEWLLALGAYRDCGSLRAFKAVFGGSCAPTRENLFKAGSAGIDVGWLARRLLTPPDYQVFREATAWEAYMKATAATWEAYTEAKAAAWEACTDAKAAALADVLWPPETGPDAGEPDR